MIKPEVLLLTDTHLKSSNIEVVKSIFNQAFNLCKKKKISDIIFSGDLFNERSHQPLEVLNAARVILKRAKKSGLKIYAIHGNHDQKNQNSKVSYLSLYNNLITLFNSSGAVKIKSLNYHFVPYFRDNNLYLKYIKKLRDDIDSKTILITHKDFNGAQNNDGSKVTTGISPKSVKGYIKVLVGHYHDPDIIKNIHYVGAAIQHNFGENTNKGFTLINNDGSLDFVQSKFPKFIKKKFLLEEFTKEECRQLAEEIKENNPDDNVRCVFVGEEYDTGKIDEDILKQAGIDIKFEKGKTLEEDIVENEDLNMPLKHNKKTLLKSFISYSVDNGFTPEQKTSMLKMLQKEKI